MSFPPVAVIAGFSQDAPPVAAFGASFASPVISPLGLWMIGDPCILGIHVGLALSDRLGTELLVGLSGPLIPAGMGGGALDRGLLAGVLPFLSLLL